MASRKIVSVVLICTGIVAVFFLSTRPKGTSISTTFKGYGTLPDFPWHSNRLFGVFIISNTGASSLVFRGVGGNDHQFVQVQTPNGWIDTDPWAVANEPTFYLAPGRVREVALLVDADSPWRTAFRFRKTDLVDYCPWFIWRVLPKVLQRVPALKELWSQSVQPPATDRHYPSMILTNSYFLLRPSNSP
jgi:hypothetical protein